MYRWLRNTHLFVGLFSCLFLLMYGVSSVQMSHNTWFSSKPSTTESRVALGAGGAGDPRALARRLMEEHGLRGEIQQIRATAAGCAFRIVRPGTVYDIDYAGLSGQAHIKTHVAAFMGMLNRLHHIGGLWHDFGLVNAWAFFLGLVSAGLVVLGLTGIYLWFKIHTERLAGGILLALSLGYSLTLMVWMRAVAP